MLTKKMNMKVVLPLCALVLSLTATAAAAETEMDVLLRVKDILEDPTQALRDWVAGPDPSPCRWRGITCNDEGSVVHVDLHGNSLRGRLPVEFCSLRSLTKLELDDNYLFGPIPRAFLACSHLEALALGFNDLNGTIPDLSAFSQLSFLDVSFNLFTGPFPVSVANLSNLGTLCLGMNSFQPAPIPPELFRLRKLHWLYLTRSSFFGPIPAAFANLTELKLLEIAENALVGTILPELGSLPKLYRLELYGNRLHGQIPPQLGNLSNLQDFDASNMSLTGHIPPAFGELRKLQFIQLYSNNLSGPIPEGFGNSSSLQGISLYNNRFSGPLPATLGARSDILYIDVSQNMLSGPLPPNLCNAHATLMNLLVLDNRFNGTVPESYGNCKRMMRFRLNKNQFQGQIPSGIWQLAHLSIMDLSYNNFQGEISNKIAKARNLSELYLQRNQFSGRIPKEIRFLSKLVKVDLSGNRLEGPVPVEIDKLGSLNSLLLQENNLTGPIPPEIGRCTMLSVLNLAANKFSGPIPESLGGIGVLNSLNLSRNLLTGKIPDSLGSLKLNTLDFSWNLLTGKIPPELIYEASGKKSFEFNHDLCADGVPSLPACEHSKPDVYQQRWIAGWISSGTIVLCLLLAMLIRSRNGWRKGAETTERRGFWDKKFFYKLNFDEHEVLDFMDEKHVIGRGGSGVVYHIKLSNGESVAVKKLCSGKRDAGGCNGGHSEVIRELRAEVETLGTIRHKNIVKLYCCFSNGDSNLLVYEYMPNGNLGDSLRRTGPALDWPTRYKIALGVANGLAYLHHDCVPPIIHRDIKSTNILLDADFQAKVADFGFAKILQACGRGESSSLAIAGTYGYIAPEYAYSSKVTEKSDVYSFGVVLLELITGQRPVEPEFGDNKDIVSWISRKVVSKEGALEVLDRRISQQFQDGMIHALKIAVRCTSESPNPRPTMREVVQMLIEAQPNLNSPSKHSADLKPHRHQIPKHAATIEDRNFKSDHKPFCKHVVNNT